MLEPLFNKVAGPKACNFIKKDTPAQVFSREYCEFFKNNFFYKTPLAAASVMSFFFQVRTGIEQVLLIPESNKTLWLLMRKL